MTIKEFMNREYELTQEELKAFKELSYAIEVPVLLSIIAILGPQLLNISMKGMF